MTDQTAFEYCDEDGDRLTARPTIGTPTPAILLHISPTNCARVRLDRVEEVVAGIRDAARQAAGQPAAELRCTCGDPIQLMNEADPTSWIHSPGSETRCLDATPAVGLAACGCGEPGTSGVVHRPDAPCYLDDTADGLAAGQPAADEPRVAELKAEIAQLHEKHKASLRHADQVTNELREEVQRYADGTERPVLWSVYNQMHNRALAAEAKLTATPAAGLAAPTNHDTETEAHPADVTFTVEKHGDTDWLTASSHYDDRDKALSRLARRREQYPDTEFRLVRETTTWTVEPDTTAGAES